MATWPKGKTFYSGDILVFKYDPDYHNVIVTDKEGHEKCAFTEHSIGYHSGDDHLQLHYGNNYFISSVSYDCTNGMNMVIFGHSPPSVF
ncbi:unnamed protein product [Linum perenne]